MKNMINNISDMCCRIIYCFLITLATLGTSLLSNPANAEVFLQGDYVELGIHDAFSFGTAGVQPPGFHGNISSRLGFVADYGRDGWSAGSPPFSGDFFLPGSPEEGWGVEWTNSSGLEVTRNNFGRNFSFQVPVTSLSDTSTATQQSAVWEGTATSGADQLRIIQTVTINPSDLYMVINVVMTNVGTTTLNSVEYMRNVDPDQEQPWTGNYTTRNWVEFQPPRPATGSRVSLAARPAGNTNKALTLAEGLTHGLTLGLGSIDERAVVAASQGFSNRDTDAILNNPFQPTPASPHVDDRAIVLAYELGSLSPGQSMSFDYAYILSASDLDEALGALAAVTILQPTGTVSGSSVLFQATTDNVPNTVEIEFYVDGVSVGTDTSPDAGAVFDTTFDSTVLPNGTASIKVVATFLSGATGEKISSITVDNAGPPISFSTPISGDIFSGTSIPIGINVLDPSQPPVWVSFFRETLSTGSIFLGEDTSATFESVFGVSDLPDGETVVIKAVGTDALGRSTTITVSGTARLNIPPTVDVGTNQTTDEGSAISFAGSFSDADVDDTHTYEWGFGDSSPTEGGSLTPSHTYADNGVYSVTLTVTDDNGGVGTDMLTVMVNNVNPIPAAGPDQITTEGSGPVSFAGSFTDPGTLDTHTILWDFGDGSPAVNGTLTPSHTYSADNGVYTVTMTVTDDDLGVGVDTLTVTVNNVAPAVDAGSDHTIDEGSGPVSFSGSFTDPGTLDIHTVVWDFGDGSPTVSGTLTPSHTYPADDGVYTVTLMVTDDDVGVGSDMLTVTVNNVVPVAAAGAGQTINEGDTATFSGSYTDPGTLDTHTVVWDFGDGSSGTTLTPSHTYKDNGTYMVTQTVTDDDDGVGVSTLTVTVNNLPPVVDPINGPVDPVAQGTAISVDSAFTDPGVLDTHAAVWDWGDSSTSPGVVTETGGSGTVTGAHSYSIPGVYTVTLTVTDKDGGSASVTYEQYIVVYDPNAGFVTGGGWIDSPYGAFMADPTLTGKATFGFVSKYQKGKSTPTGSTEFQFRVADLKFHSGTYDWLVIAGSRAQFKGVGTVNGSGNYGFFITAIDGALNGGDGTDKFRIKVWDIDNGDAVVYDNEVSEAIDSDPTTIIANGSIVIHTKEKK